MNSNKTSRGKTSEEAGFHNKCFLGEPATANKLERWILSLSPAMPDPIDKMTTALGEVRDKRICEIGCGSGGLTRELAFRGAYVSASDVSAEAVRLTRDTAREFIPEKVDVQQMDACNLLYSDASFDLVVGMAILHHVDIYKASKEINRVLKPRCKAVFIEPLAHNPISNIWRRLSPTVRTKDERPLAYSEISEMGKLFSSVRCQEYALLTLLSSFVCLITHSQKAKERSAELLDRLDPVLLQICKPLRKCSGAALIEFTK